jgi:glutaconate CoA-transferase subunit B
MMPTAKRVATWRTEHSVRTLVDKLDFVTAAGNLQTVVTPIAVFQKRDGRLALESRNPRVTLDEIIRRTGFKFDASGAKLTAPITARERAALESLDPRGEFAAAVRA